MLKRFSLSLPFRALTAPGMRGETTGANSWHIFFSTTSQVLTAPSHVSIFAALSLKVVKYLWGPYGFIFVPVASYS
jgi:hypothetical protein